MTESEAFPVNPKNDDRVSQWREHDYDAYNKKNGDCYEYPSLSHFKDWTLIIRKMMESKAFLGNPKHQGCVSQRGEHDCGANNKKNRDYYEHPSLSHFID